ncbi:MAG: FkbM family methyltransferase [Solirubrobacterales bacterium]
MLRAAQAIMPAIPRGCGDRRAAQSVYRRMLGDGRGGAALATVGTASLELSLDDWPQAQAYLLRRYDPSTVEFICRHLPADGVFVDGGAHVGLISMQVAANVPGVSIHAFEPHPEKFPSLQRNAARNGARMTANNFGLSDSATALAYDADRHTIDAGADSSIEVVALDSYAAHQALTRIDVLKLDIEGHELAALHGAGKLLAERRIGAVTMESLHGDTNEPMRLLESLGYRRVTMPDTRPRWLASRRPMPVENVGYVAPLV